MHVCINDDVAIYNNFNDTVALSWETIQKMDAANHHWVRKELLTDSVGAKDITPGHSKCSALQCIKADNGIAVYFK